MGAYPLCRNPCAPYDTTDGILSHRIFYGIYYRLRYQKSLSHSLFAQLIVRLISAGVQGISFFHRLA